MFKRKFSKVKVGKIGMINNTQNIKGRGTPAIKKIDVEELNELDKEYNLKKEGKGLIKKSIRPLQFKM